MAPSKFWEVNGKLRQKLSKHQHSIEKRQKAKQNIFSKICVELSVYTRESVGKLP